METKLQPRKNIQYSMKKVMLSGQHDVKTQKSRLKI